jgi:hypothetical protein
MKGWLPVGQPPLTNGVAACHPEVTEGSNLMDEKHVQ